jgi:hypothetical protein
MDGRIVTIEELSYLIRNQTGDFPALSRVSQLIQATACLLQSTHNIRSISLCGAFMAWQRIVTSQENRRQKTGRRG